MRGSPFEKAGDMPGVPPTGATAVPLAPGAVASLLTDPARWGSTAGEPGAGDEAPWSWPGAREWTAASWRGGGGGAVDVPDETTARATAVASASPARAVTAGP